MKKWIMMTGLFLGLSGQASAVHFLDAYWDAKEDTIELELGFSGCSVEGNEFELEASPVCLESYPAQCFAKIIHTGQQPCEAYLTKKVSFKADFPHPSYVTISNDDTGDEVEVLVGKLSF